MQRNENSNVEELPLNNTRRAKAEGERCKHERGSVRCCLPAGHDSISERGDGHRYKCAGDRCPGLPWPASEIAHSVNCTTGGIRE